MAFEEEFGVEIDDAAETIVTVGDAVKFLSASALIGPQGRSTQKEPWLLAVIRCGASS